jgi:mannose-1-phosphate guanylyltransferase
MFTHEDAVDTESHRLEPLTARPSALWIIVLAGGEGQRLAPLTTALHGKATPKQFASLVGQHSMLQRTLMRARALAPWQRIVVVATGSQGDLARQQAQALGPATVLVQPANLGTGPGILLPLTYIRSADPSARVLVLPSDHHVTRPRLFEEALEDLVSPSALGHGVVLLGVQPDGPETDYGWILPGRPLTLGPPVLRKVVRFVEKPAATVASQLMAREALWNTLVFAATGAALWQTTQQALPRHAARFAAFAKHIDGNERGQLHQLYADLPSADFSKDVLAGASGLAVASAPPCGWSDWGTPERVFESLAGTRELEQLQRRLRGRAIARLPAEWNA